MERNLENIVRKEFNGCIIYSKKLKKSIYVDHCVLAYLSGKSKNELIEEYSISHEDLDSLIAYLESMKITKENVYLLQNDSFKGKLSAPLRLFLDYTFKCNLRCKHCFTESGEKKDNELTFEEKKRIVDQMVEMGCYKLSIAGGEPLIDETFFDLVRYAKTFGVDVSFTTNGLLLNDENISKINRCGFKTITVSLDGATAETHEIIRGKGTFESTLENIRNLRKRYKGKIALRLTMMKTNVREVEKFIQLAETLRCNKIKFNCIRPTGRADINKELLINRDEYIDIIKRASDYGKSSKVDVILPSSPFTECNGQFIDNLGFGCVAGKDSMTIFPDGEIKACSQMSGEFIAGNAKKDSLKDIWLNSPQFNYFRELEGNATCKTCDVYERCRGGCRYRTLKEYGDINEVDPFCFENKQREKI